jgi:hypothetical protein
MQANKMKSISERRFCEGNIGKSVKIKIPDVDRARSNLTINFGSNYVRYYNQQHFHSVVVKQGG